jgi:hypothetical protein
VWPAGILPAVQQLLAAVSGFLKFVFIRDYS